MADVTWLVQILAVLVVVLGVIVLYVAVLFSLAWFAHKAMKITKVWHFYSLAVSMRLHGKAADVLAGSPREGAPKPSGSDVDRQHRNEQRAGGIR
jgi:hypothetical protein